jgi:hypothetical protein
MQTINIHAQFEYSVNVQPEFSLHLRKVFAVVKQGAHPYCWGALRMNQTRQQQALSYFDPFDSLTSHAVEAQRPLFTLNLS